MNEAHKDCPACGEKMREDYEAGVASEYVAWCSLDMCNWEEAFKSDGESDAEDAMEEHMEVEHGLHYGVFERDIPRSGHKKGDRFLVCSGYGCDHEEPLPIAAQLRAQGAAPLPGFDDKSLGLGGDDGAEG